MLGGVVSSSSSLPGHLHDRELAFHYAAKRFETPVPSSPVPSREEPYYEEYLVNGYVTHVSNTKPL
jgi:hypothetical protein